MECCEYVPEDGEDSGHLADGADLVAYHLLAGGHRSTCHKQTRPRYTILSHSNYAAIIHMEHKIYTRTALFAFKV